MSIVLYKKDLPEIYPGDTMKIANRIYVVARVNPFVRHFTDTIPANSARTIVLGVHDSSYGDTIIHGGFAGDIKQGYIVYFRWFWKKTGDAKLPFRVYWGEDGIPTKYEVLFTEDEVNENRPLMINRVSFSPSLNLRIRVSNNTSYDEEQTFGVDLREIILAPTSVSSYKVEVTSSGDVIRVPA